MKLFETSKPTLWLLCSFLVVALSHVIDARPPGNETDQRRQALGDAVVVAAEEGVDMLLTDEQKASNKKDDGGSGRVKRKSDYYTTWPNSHVVFEIVDIDSSLIPLVLEAIDDWSRYTCITFEEYNYIDPNQHRVQFLSTTSGCYSYVGYIGGIQGIYLAASGCSHISVILHEIGHTLGLLHEQTRTNRDDYLTVIEENVQGNYLSQYDIVYHSEDETIPYDFGSIMHYSQWAFSKNTYNPDYATMVAHDPMKQDSMGQHGRLSHLDKLFSNKHYSCMDHCSEAELDQPCLYGGFVGKYCTCECPEGLEGPYCEVMTPSITEDCGGHFTEDNGEITSPNYPSNYPVLVSCNYLITAPEGYTIELTFDDDFYIEDETYCYWDQLLIRHDSPMYYNAAARFCGDTLAGETVTSLSNVMYVNLYSDDYITEHGFRATYTFVDGTSPSLTCPSDRLLTVDGASAIVEFNAPIVVDNSNDDLTSSCTPPSGSSFPVGTTQVTCSAVDSDQNTETCTFDVTIQVTYSPDKLVSTDDGYQAIIVTDNEAPQLTCASSLSVTVVEDDLPSIITFNDPAVSDNSGETLQPTCSIPSGSSFNVGTTVVDCVAVDASGNQGSCSFDVIVEVDYPPVLTCPSTQIIPITNDAEEVIVDYTPAGVQDSEDPGLTATCQPPPSTLFPLGNTTVVCSAIDSMKNVGECQFDIIIKVDYPPNLTCGSNHESPTDDGTSTASVDFKLAYAHDKEDGELTAICQPPPSSLFHIGTSHVICSATDSVGNSEQCGFNITILDNEAPKLTCSSLVTLLTNPGEATATLLYDNALVTDNSGEVLQSECTPAVPGVLGIGTHSGSCFAIDSSNNQGTCDFPIEVKDEEDPEIVCPDSITVEAPESAISTTVNFDLPTVHDNSATNIIPTCSSQSGMNFSIGVTKIDCFATDSSNNENECTFDITVTSSGSIEVPAIGGCDDKEDYYFGSIQSENYPGPYERNTNCQWQIDVPDGHFAYMWFERTVDIEAYISNQIYCYDYITIKTFKRNFINIRVSVENHYCAQQLPEDISTNDDIIIYFTSDDMYQWTGFSLKYKVQPTEPPAWDSWSDWSECSATCGSGYKTRHRACSTSDCIGHSTQDLSCDLNKCANGCEPGMGHTLIEGVGQILSPGYPFQYPKSYFISRSSPCSVTVDVPVGKSVTFYFDDLDLTSSTFCFFDYLEFSSPDKKYILCGNDKSVQVPTFTKGPVEVIFRTDSALLYNTFSRGFDMKYIFN